MQEGGLTDVAIEVLHRVLCHVIHGPREQVGVGDEQVTAFLETLKKGLCFIACCYSCIPASSISLPGIFNLISSHLCSKVSQPQSCQICLVES